MLASSRYLAVESQFQGPWGVLLAIAFDACKEEEEEEEEEPKSGDGNESDDADEAVQLSSVTSEMGTMSRRNLLRRCLDG